MQQAAMLVLCRSTLSLCTSLVTSLNSINFDLRRFENMLVSCNVPLDLGWTKYLAPTNFRKCSVLVPVLVTWLWNYFWHRVLRYPTTWPLLRDIVLQMFTATFCGTCTKSVLVFNSCGSHTLLVTRLHTFLALPSDANSLLLTLCSSSVAQCVSNLVVILKREHSYYCTSSPSCG